MRHKVGNGGRRKFWKFIRVLLELDLNNIRVNFQSNIRKYCAIALTQLSQIWVTLIDPKNITRKCYWLLPGGASNLVAIIKLRKLARQETDSSQQGCFLCLPRCLLGINQSLGGARGNLHNITLTGILHFWHYFTYTQIANSTLFSDSILKF